MPFKKGGPGGPGRPKNRLTQSEVKLPRDQALAVTDLLARQEGMGREIVTKTTRPVQPPRIAPQPESPAQVPVQADGSS